MMYQASTIPNAQLDLVPTDYDSLKLFGSIMRPKNMLCSTWNNGIVIQKSHVWRFVIYIMQSCWRSLSFWNHKMGVVWAIQNLSGLLRVGEENQIDWPVPISARCLHVFSNKSHWGPDELYTRKEGRKGNISSPMLHLSWCPPMYLGRKNTPPPSKQTVWTRCKQRRPSKKIVRCGDRWRFLWRRAVPMKSWKVLIQKVMHCPVSWSHYGLGPCLRHHKNTDKVDLYSWRWKRYIQYPFF